VREAEPLRRPPVAPNVRSGSSPRAHQRGSARHFQKPRGTAAATEKAGGRWRCGRNRVKRQVRRPRRRDEERREGGGGGTGRD
jgi:hypothetical protein